MEQHWDAQACQKEAVKKKTAYSTFIDSFTYHFRHFKKRKVHPFIVDPLPGEEVEQ